MSATTNCHGVDPTESRFDGIDCCPGGKRPIASALRHTGMDTPPARSIGSSSTLHADPTLKALQKGLGEVIMIPFPLLGYILATFRSRRA